MFELLIDKFTSRKFLFGIAGFVVFILIATGIIDASNVAEAATAASAAVYIIVEGIIDHRAVGDGADLP